MNLNAQFGAELSPAITLLDPHGRTSAVLPAHALEAIELADRLREIGGAGHTRSLSGKKDANAPAILLYYVSNKTAPAVHEIAEAAHIIWESQVCYNDGRSGSKAEPISGRRAVVHPKKPGGEQDRIVFLVSTRVWFNENRSTVNFPSPSNKGQVAAFLKDINERLPLGRVSVAR